MNAELEAQQKAAGFREAHGLGVAPIGDLVALIEEVVGVDVAIVEAPSSEHGITMRDPVHGLTIIAAATSIHPMRQRSTLAHELAHVLFEEWLLPVNTAPPAGRPAEEIRADAFARHLLAPEGGIRTLLSESALVTEAELSRVVQHFQVSPAIAAIALCSAGLIDAEQKKQWRGVTALNLAARYGWATDYFAMQDRSRQKRPPQKLLARAIRGYQEGLVQAKTLALLRSIQPEGLLLELEEAGIKPRETSTVSVLKDSLPRVEVDLSGLDDLEDPAKDQGN